MFLKNAIYQLLPRPLIQGTTLFGLLFLSMSLVSAQTIIPRAPEIAATGGDSNVSLKLTPKGSGQVLIDGNVGIETGLIDLKNGGSQSAVRLYCESSNAHYAAIQAPAHADFSDSDPHCCRHHSRCE